MCHLYGALFTDSKTEPSHVSQLKPQGNTDVNTKGASFSILLFYLWSDKLIHSHLDQFLVGVFLKRSSLCRNFHSKSGIGVVLDVGVISVVVHTLYKSSFFSRII